MRRLNVSLLVAVTAASLLLGGCGQTKPTVAPPPSPGETATVPEQTPTISVGPSQPASPTPVVSETPAPSVTATPTATPTSSPTSAPPQAKGLVLSGSGIGGNKFGTAEAKVEKAIAAVLGEPDDSAQGVLCELDSSSPWHRSVFYDGLVVLFTAETGSKTAPRTLNSWSMSVKDVPKKVTIEDGIPLNLTFKELKAKYPKGKLEDTGLGDGSQIFTLPSGLRFVGEKKPDLVMAGELHYCE